MKKIATRLSLENIEALNQEKKETGRSKTFIINIALKRYFKGKKSGTIQK